MPTPWRVKRPVLEIWTSSATTDCSGRRLMPHCFVFDFDFWGGRSPAHGLPVYLWVRVSGM